MNKYWLILLLLFPVLSQAKCSLGNNTTAQQSIEIDMTSGAAVIPVKTNLHDEFSCDFASDKMYYATPLQNYVVEFKGTGSQKSIFMQIKLTGNGFPVTIGNQVTTTDNVINTKSFTLEANYIKSGTADLTVSGNSINLNRPAISILTDNTCNNNLFSWIFCWLTGKLNSNVSYSQNIIFTVKHKPTTCHFSQNQYVIAMPETTLNEIIAGNNTKTGTTNLILNCDSVYNVTTNPVSFNISHGDWNENGTILKNTLAEGAKGVGFQIYSGSGTTPLMQGDILRTMVKMTSIEDKYTIPITAKYVRVSNEPLRPGNLQSKVIFAVSYD